MPIRNLFKRFSVLEPAQSGEPDGEFRVAIVVGANTVDVHEPLEIQLSEINHNGVFVHPLPTEKPGFWQTRSNSSLASSNYQSIFADNETFTISRESFDSYRRSFDISARSPIPSFDAESFPRSSLESSRVSSMHERRKSDWPEDNIEENFEEVDIDDEQRPVMPKKRSLFARFGIDSSIDVSKPTSTGLHHSVFSSRKRAQSGQGSELASMSQPQSMRDIPVVKVIAD